MQTRKLRIILATLCCLSPAILLAQQVRLALIVESPAIQPAADLLTAELSAKPELVLLERAQIEKIMREQQLTATSAQDNLKLGQVLGADGLILLNTNKENDRSLLSARLVAVKPGVILRTMPSPWPLENTAEWPKLAARQFEPLFPKLAVLVKDAVPISILNLRSAVKTVEAERLEKELTLLLIDRLSREKEVFVLERHRMALLSAEKELKGMADTEFWNGSYLLEGVVDKDGYNPDTVTLTVRLVAPDRRSQTLSAAGPRQDLPAVADSLTRQVLVKLNKSTTAPAWNSSTEAAQYLNEARWAMRWKLYEQAQWAADAAWALGSHTLETARLRVTSYSQPAIIYSNYFVPDADLATAQVDGVYPQRLDGLAASLENFASIAPLLGTNADASAFADEGLKALDISAAHLWRYWFTPKAIPAVQNKLARLREAARHAELVLLDGEQQPTPRTYESRLGKRVWQLKTGLGWLWAESPREIILEYRRLLAAGLGEEQQRQFVNRGSGSPRLVAWTPQDWADIPRLWAEFLREQAQSTNATTVLLAQLLRYNLTPFSELAEGPEAKYANPAGPIYEALEQSKTSLLCKQHRLLMNALDVADSRQVPRWPPHGIPTKPDLRRHFRTNFVQFWIEQGRCLDPELAQRVFAPPDFETNHLAVLVGRISSLPGSTNVTHDWRKVFFRVSLSAHYDYFGFGPGYAETYRQRELVFGALFHPQDYSPEEARSLLRQLQSFRNDKAIPGDPVAKDIAALEAHLARSQPAPVLSPPPPSASQPEATGNSLLVSRWWEAPTNSVPRPVPGKRTATSNDASGTFYSDLRLLHLLHREGRLWLEARFIRHSSITNETGWLGYKKEVFGRIYEVDLKDFSHRQQTFFPEQVVADGPFRWMELQRSFEVLNHQVYLVLRDKLLTAPAGETNWHELDVALPGSMVPFAVNGHLCLGSSDTLLEVEPASNATRVLASIRRRPAVSEVDQLQSYGRPVFFSGGSNRLHVLLGTSVWTWDAAQRKWDYPLSRLLSAGQRPSYADECQILFRTGEAFAGSQPLRRLAERRLPETLFELGRQTNPRLELSGRPSPTPARWNPAEDLKPQDDQFAPDGENLWWLRRGIETPYQLVFYDDRWEEPIVIPLRFNREKPVPDVMPGIRLKISLRAGSEGLVIFPHLSFGFWFIPRADLENAIMARLQQQPHTPRVTRPMPVLAAGPPPSDTKQSIWVDERGTNYTRIVHTYDQNQDGKLDLAELIYAIGRERALEGFRPTGSRKTYRSTVLIQPFDMDKDGKLNAQELQQMVQAGRPAFEAADIERGTNLPAPGAALPRAVH